MTEDFRRARPDRQRPRRGIRRHHGSRPDRASGGRRHRVPPLAGRAMDEAAPLWPTLSHSPGFVMRHGPAMLGTRSGAARCARSSGWRQIARCSRGTRRSGAWSARATASEFGHLLRYPPIAQPKNFPHARGQASTDHGGRSAALPAAGAGRHRGRLHARRRRPRAGDPRTDSAGRPPVRPRRRSDRAAAYRSAPARRRLRRGDASWPATATSLNCRSSSPRRDCRRPNLILADLGVSSMQIDDPARGFSYKAAGPLDMRMNPVARRAGVAAARPARAKPDLAALLTENADEPHARADRAVVETRARDNDPCAGIVLRVELGRRTPGARRRPTSRCRSAAPFRRCASP